MMDLLNSKKFSAGLIAAIVGGVLIYLELPFEQVMALISPFLTYQIGQGIADHGKEKAKMEGVNEMLKNGDGQ